jgi:transposase
MSQALAITRHDHSAGELRKLAGEREDADVVRRLLAIAMVLDGYSRTEAARNNGMDRQTLRDWVLRYNAEGVDGLRSRKSPGRPPALTKEQLQEFKTIVISGPDLEKH